MGGVELVFHQGALPSVPRSVQDPLTTNEVNVGGTLNVLLAARDEGVRRVVFASSSSVYGDADGFRRERDAASAAALAVRCRASSPPRATAARSGRCTGSRRYRCATSTCSARGRTPNSQYAAVVPRFIARLAQGQAADDLRRREPVARLHIRRQRRRRQPPRRDPRRTWPARCSTWRRAAAARSTSSRP